LIEIRPPSRPQPGESAGPLTASIRLPALLKNEIVQGKVIQLLADQDAVIAIKHRNVIARSQVPLEKDQVLLLRVEQTSPTPLLRLLGSVGRAPGAASLLQAVEQNPWRQVLESLGKPMAISREQRLLRDLLNDLSTLFSKPGDRSPLREWVEKSGVSLESRLCTLCRQGRQTPDEVDRLLSGDLKGLLARMVHEEEVAPPMVERLFKLIETLQWFNHGSLDQAGKLFLLLPCQVSDGFWTVAQLLIHKEEEGSSTSRSKAKACRIVFLAEFSNLGWVRAEVTVEGKEVRMGFLSGSADSATLLQRQLPVLIGNLKSQGFQVRDARCGMLDPDLLKHSMIHELTGVGTDSFSTFA
jgi:hypothetical protein